MTEFIRPVVAELQLFAAESELKVPVVPPVAPIGVPVARLRRMAEKLHLHLLEFPRAKGKVPRRDLVAEAFSGLRDSERYFGPHGVEDVLEVNEHSLGRFGAEERRIFRAPQRAKRGFEHQVEFTRLGELALVVLARMLARLEG